MKNKTKKEIREEKANIKDSYGNDVYFGDTFWAYMMRPSAVLPTKVTVVKDESEENLECDRNFDVEDEKGNRLWNAYMIIAVDCERGDKPHKWDNGLAYFQYMKHRATREKQTKPDNKIIN